MEMLDSFLQLLSLGEVLTPPDITPLPQSTSADQALIGRILTVTFTILGAVAVLVAVIGGIKFAGSQGDPQGTAKARNTIIYAIIGLIVAILARSLVDFVLTRVA